MGLHADDIKILINLIFQFLMKSFRQFVKDHPVISGFVLLLLFFYVYFLALFYISPLLICTAIVLGQFHFGYQNGKTFKPDYRTNSITTEICSTPKTGLHSCGKHRATIHAAMSRRTFRKGRYGGGTAVMADLKDDISDNIMVDEMSMKSQEENVAYTSMYPSSLSSNLVENGEARKQGAPILDCCQKSSGEVRAHDAESQEDDGSKDGEPKEGKSKSVVEWRQDDLRNLMDFGSSEIERNRRMENLIARRRAKKMFSMLPQRNPSSLVTSDLEGHASSVLAGRIINDTEGQPGSAPSVLLPTRNPFDLPYDPSEEKPVLNGGIFVDESSSTQSDDILYYRHESFKYEPSFVEDIGDRISMPALGYSRNPAGPGLSRFGRQSDAKRKIKQISEQLSHEVQLNSIQNDSHEQANMLPSKAGGTVVPGAEHVHEEAVNIGDARTEEGKEVEDSEKENNLAIEPIVRPIDEPEIKPGLAGDCIDETCSSSSLEASQAVVVVVASENEALRNSVRKGLTCLVPKSRGAIGRKKIIPPCHPHPACNPFDDSIPRVVYRTNMEELSFYTEPFHKSSHSIASDMLDEVSEACSIVYNDEPYSPNDIDSLVYDADEDRDVYSGDEDLWGASPHPVSLQEPGMRLSAQEVEQSKSLFGSAIALRSSGLQQHRDNQACEDASPLLSSSSTMPKESKAPLLDLRQSFINENQKALIHAHDSMHSVSSLSGPMDYPVISKPQRSKHNIDNLQACDIGSTISEEQGLCYPWESSSEESERVNKLGDQNIATILHTRES